MTQLYQIIGQNPTVGVLICMALAPVTAFAFLMIWSLCKAAHVTDEQLDREQEERLQKWGQR